MAEEVAHGYVQIDLEEDVHRELERLEAHYRATMAAIDRMKAEATIAADISQFEAKYKQAQDQVRILEGQRAEVDITADTSDLDRDLAKARAEVKRLDGMKAQIEIDSRDIREATANIERLAKLQEATAKAEYQLDQGRQRIWRRYQKQIQDQGRMEARAYAENIRRDQQLARESLQNANKVARVQSSFAKQREREMAAAEQAAHRMNTELDRQPAQVAKLRLQYAQLTNEIEKLGTGRAKFGEAGVIVRLKEENLRARMAEIKGQLEFMGSHPPVGIKVDLDEGFFQRSLFRMRRGLADFGNKLANIGNIRINLGPLSGTLRTIAAAAALLSPILVSIGGALTALGGTLVTSVIGSGSIAAGVLTGLATNFGGVIASLKPFVEEMKIAKQATDAYQKAVLKYGKGTDEAKRAQDQMNNVLKNVDPVAAKAAKGATDLRTNWDKLTKQQTQKNLGALLTSGFRTLNALMPTLAGSSNKAFETMTTRSQNFFKSLRQPEMIRTFDSLGRSANTFLGPALDGAAALSRAFLNVGESAARIFAGRAGASFANWARGLEAAAAPGAKLDATMSRMGNHAASLGRLLMNVGRLMKTVFLGGADEGDRLVDALDRTVVRWNEFLNTTEGQKGMQEFFQRAGAGAQQLAGALGPLIASFVRWAGMLTPFTTGFLVAITAITRVIAKITELLSLQGPMAVFGATLATIWSINRIGAFIGALTTVLGLLRNIAATQGGLAAVGALASGSVFRQAKAARRGGQALDTAKDAAQLALFGGAAGAGAAKVNVFRAAATKLIPAIASLGAVAGGAATAGVFALGGAAVYGFSKLVSMQSATEKLQASIGKTTGATTQFIGAMGRNASAVVASGQAQYSYAQTVGRVAEAKKALARAEEEGGKKSAGYRQALLNLNSALQTRAQAEQQVEQTAKQRDQAADARNKALEGMRGAEDNLTTALERRDRLQEQAAAGGRAGAGAYLLLKEASENVARAQAAVNNKTSAYAAAAKQAAIDTLNYHRALAGLIPLGEQAAASLAKLARTRPATAQRIAERFPDPGEAGRVGAAARRALGAGVRQRIVMDIVVNAKDAHAAIRQLNAARIRRQVVDIVNRGGVQTYALLARLAGVKLNAKQLRILETGGRPALAMISRIIARKINDKRFAAILRDLASGKIAGVKGLLASLRDKTVTLTTITRSINIQETRRTTLAPVPDAATYNKLPGTGQHGFSRGEYQGEALVGEGKGPEWRWNARTGEVEKITGPRFMRLDRDDAIIPTEPAFRDRARAIFMQMAMSLGLPMFAAGRRPTKLTRKQKRAAAQRARAMPIPPRIQFAAVDEGQAEKERNAARKHYSTRADTLDKLTEKIKKEREKKKPNKKKIEQWTTTRDRLAGGLQRLYRLYQESEVRFLELKRVNERIVRWNTDQSTAHTEMENAARLNQPGQYAEARARRATILGKLRHHYGMALRLARDPNLRATIAKDIAETASSIIETEQSQFEPPAWEDPYLGKEISTLSVEEFLTNIGKIGELRQLEAEKIRAQIATPLDMNDDRAAAQALVSFYEDIYGRISSFARMYPIPRHLELEAAVGQELLGARQELESARAPTADESAIAEQLRVQLRHAQTESAIAHAFAETAGGPGDIGTGSYYSARQAGGAGPNIFINTLHPGDPATLHAIGSAATAGMGYQGSRPAPRSWSGY